MKASKLLTQQKGCEISNANRRMHTENVLYGKMAGHPCYMRSISEKAVQNCFCKIFINLNNFW